MAMNRASVPTTVIPTQASHLTFGVLWLISSSPSNKGSWSVSLDITKNNWSESMLSICLLSHQMSAVVNGQKQKVMISRLWISLLPRRKFGLKGYNHLSFNQQQQQAGNNPNSFNMSNIIKESENLKWFLVNFIKASWWWKSCNLPEGGSRLKI